MAITKRVAPARRVAAVVLCLAIAGACFGQSLTYLDQHDFSTAQGTTYNPGQGGISFDANGNMFGTTIEGGPYQTDYVKGGAVWEITASGTYEILHYFGSTILNADGSLGPDGFNPQSTIIVDENGNLFGTTAAGGANFFLANSPADQGGMIWEITTSGVYKDLHDFGGIVLNADGDAGQDGQEPMGTLYRDASGDLFGVAPFGGAYYNVLSGEMGGGVLWEVTAAGVYMDLHDFGGAVTNANGSLGPDGLVPQGGVIADTAGDLFGTASEGGPYNSDTNYGGVLWVVTAGGLYKDLYDFGSTTMNADGTTGPDGQSPEFLALDATGNIYGNASRGGPFFNTFANASDLGGVLWELTTGGTYKDLHDFGGTTTNASGISGPDGQAPNGPIAIDGFGSVFGTTKAGSNYFGLAWEQKSTGQYVDWHDFANEITNTNGAVGPDCDYGEGVALGPNGYLYGVGDGGGAFGGGIVWKTGPQKTLSLTLSPSTIGGLGTTVGTVILAGPAPTGGWKVKLMAGASGYLNLPPSVTVPEGATSATFVITGTAQRSSSLSIGIIASAPDTSFEPILKIQGDEVTGLSFSPSVIGGDGSTYATVTIASPAPPEGWVIYPKAAVAGYLRMPPTVIIGAGYSEATFIVYGANERTGNANIGVIASDGNASVEGILTVQGDALQSITLSPASIGPNGISTGTVTLNSAAPLGGWVVNLMAGSPGYLNMPTSVTIPAGSTTATFTVTGASQRKGSVTVGVIANDTGNQVEADLTLIGDSLSGVSVSPTSVAPGGSSTGTVTLTAPAPAGGWIVRLSSGGSEARVPASVAVPAGQTSATFTIQTFSLDVPTQDGIFATDGVAQFEALLTIT